MLDSLASLARQAHKRLAEKDFTEREHAGPIKEELAKDQQEIDEVFADKEFNKGDLEGPEVNDLLEESQGQNARSG